MLGLKINHVSKRGHRWHCLDRSAQMIRFLDDMATVCVMVKFDNSQNVLLNLSSHWHQTCHNSCWRCLSYNNKPWFRYMGAVWSPEHDTKYHWIVFQDKYLICIQPSYWVSFGRPHVVLQFISLCLFQFNSQTQRLLSWPTFSYIRS